MAIIGQKLLLNKINSFDFTTFPHSSIILGEQGSGKHLMVNYIATKLGLDLIDITENITTDTLNEIYLSSIPSLYLIDSSLITEKEQNILLKIVEEPSPISFIIILSETKLRLLDTLINRCISFDMDLYSKEELSTFIKNEKDKSLILKIFRTPGKIITANTAHLKEIYSLCNKIVTKINMASYSNTLTIIDRLNYKDEYDKYDYNIFIDLLVLALYDNYKKTKTETALNMYIETNYEIKKLQDRRINKKNFITCLLTKLWLLNH